MIFGLLLNLPLGFTLPAGQEVSQSRTRVVYAGPHGADMTPSSGRFGSALWGGMVGGREIVAIGASQAGSRAQPEFGEVIVLEDRKVAWRARGRRAQDAFGSSIVAVDREGTGTPDALAIG